MTLLSKIRKHGLIGSGKILWRKMLKIVARNLKWPAYYLLKICNYRIVEVYGARIGHLAVEPDLFVKEGLLNMRPAFKGIMPRYKEKATNRCLLHHWNKYLKVVESEFIHQVLYSLRDQKDIIYPCHSKYTRACNYNMPQANKENLKEIVPTPISEIQKKWHDRPPLLKLSEKEIIRGQKQLQAWGMPKDAAFVCLHNREAGFASKDDINHYFRNADIKTYDKAIDAIIARGYWCIRMGDSAMKPIKNREMVIDYAVSFDKSEEMDIFLCAAAKAFLGCSSGLFFVASIFGVRVALVNMIPITTVLPYATGDIGIPKLLKKDGKFLTFRETIEKYDKLRHTLEYKEAGLEIIDNDPEEIYLHAMELLDIVEGNIQYNEEDRKRQRQFKSLLKPGHYCYDAGSNIGKHFLQKYSELL